MQTVVNIRYFAAARAAAGVESETVAIEPGSSIEGLVAYLGRREPKLASVLARCTFLCDGLAVRDKTELLVSNQTVDVLPPFAGG